MTNWTAPKLPVGLLTLAESIARVEGWYIQGTTPNRPQRNNNPGDLEYHAWMAEKYGATLETGHAANRFAVFPTADAGWAALGDLLKGPSYCKLTIAMAIDRFAPPCENNTANYKQLVSKWTGFNSSQLVEEVTS
jgi:hypothetical protein